MAGSSNVNGVPQPTPAAAAAAERQDTPRKATSLPTCGSPPPGGASIDSRAAFLDLMEAGDPARPPLGPAEALAVLRQVKPTLSQQFGVTEPALFGSTARNPAHPASDVDILVAFSGPATSARYFGVQFYLEDRLGRPVDLVTHGALRAELRALIESEAIHV